MRSIHLHGALGAQFGTLHRFHVESVPEVIDALRANYPGFIAAIRDGFYKIVLGKSHRTGLVLREDQLNLNIGNRAVHIVPVPAGRKNGGLGKVIAGVALVGLSMVSGGAIGGLMATQFAGGTVGGLTGSFGMAMALNGVSSMLAPEQRAGDKKQSFTMSGPVSNLKEGNIVPIAYGEVVTGGYMISGSIEIDGSGPDTPPEVRSNPNNGAGGSLTQPITADSGGR